MKKLIVVLLALVLVLSLVACGGKSADEPDTDKNDESFTDESINEDAAAPDLSKVDYDIAFGDFDAMGELQQKIGNFEAENAVLKIDGICEKIGSSYSIMEEDGTGKKLGVTLIVDGWTDADYPADGAHVQILGVVITDGLSHYISVLPENITVVPEG